MRPQIAPAPMPPAAASNGAVAGSEEERDDDGRQRHDRSDRQVDPAGDDDHRHAERRRADDGGLPRDELEIVAAEELRSDEESEDDRDEREADERAGGFEHGPRGEPVATHPGLGPGGFEHQVVLGEFGDRPRRAQAPAVHDGDAIAQTEQLGNVAADHQHGAWFASGRAVGAGWLARGVGGRPRSDTSASMSS